MKTIFYFNNERRPKTQDQDENASDNAPIAPSSALYLGLDGWRCSARGRPYQEHPRRNARKSGTSFFYKIVLILGPTLNEIRIY